MSACAWCYRFTGDPNTSCQFPQSEQCLHEARLEYVAHAINAQLTKAKP